MSTPFNMYAERYDSWFESAEGQAIFEIETKCLWHAMGTIQGRWLEVGVGTGRVATRLGISEGIDPSRSMLALAVPRGIHAVQGVAEDLPYVDSSFEGVVMVTTLCFLGDPVIALSECFRVLNTHGSLVVGIVPAGSAWGKSYTAKARDGHPIYDCAHFQTCEHVVLMCSSVGFLLNIAVSCLLSKPGAPVRSSLHNGIDENAGFVVMRFRKKLEIPL